MAELEGVDGILGNETPEGEGAGTVAGADAVALSLAMQEAGRDPALSRAASDYLAEQKHLVQIQIKHFDEERRLGIAAAKRRRYADHMRNWLYTCIALLALGVLAAAVRMTFEAMSDHSLVVEDFTVPSDFAARGVTSQALAEDLASRVAAIRASVNRRSITYSSDVRADQAGTLKVQIPETGISVDELERFLHRWLGHQTVVNAQLREAPGGADSIVLHIAGAEPIVVNGSGADLDLDRLMQAAAEKAFAIFDPVNDVIYLGVKGRPVEAYDAALRYAQSEGVAMSSLDRANAYALLGTADPDGRRGLSRALLATDLDPYLAIAWNQAAARSRDLGHDEAAVDFDRRMLGTKRRDQPASEQDAYPWLIGAVRAAIYQATGDFAALRAALRPDDQFYAGGGGPSVQLGDRYAESAKVVARLHDVAVARQDLVRALAAGPGDSRPPDTPPDGTVLQARWDIDAAAGNWAQALDAAKALVADEEAQKSAEPNPQFAARPELALETQYRPLLAYAEAMTGDSASATALIAQTPTDCYLCVRMRGRIAAAAGDAATADRWFAEAIRQAPDLPMAYYEWGQALLARGDLAGAARELSLAHEKGPHFADALKAWGDVLVKQGHAKDALAKYDEARKYAPNWSALQAARNAAAAPTATSAASSIPPAPRA